MLKNIKEEKKKDQPKGQEKNNHNNEHHFQPFGGFFENKQKQKEEEEKEKKKDQPKGQEKNNHNNEQHFQPFGGFFENKHKQKEEEAKEKKKLEEKQKKQHDNEVAQAARNQLLQRQQKEEKIKNIMGALLGAPLTEKQKLEKAKQEAEEARNRALQAEEKLKKLRNQPPSSVTYETAFVPNFQQVLEYAAQEARNKQSNYPLQKDTPVTIVNAYQMSQNFGDFPIVEAEQIQPKENLDQEQQEKIRQQLNQAKELLSVTVNLPQALKIMQSINFNISAVNSDEDLKLSRTFYPQSLQNLKMAVSSFNDRANSTVVEDFAHQVLERAMGGFGGSNTLYTPHKKDIISTISEAIKANWYKFDARKILKQTDVVTTIEFVPEFESGFQQTLINLIQKNIKPIGYWRWFEDWSKKYSVESENTWDGKKFPLFDKLKAAINNHVPSTRSLVEVDMPVFQCVDAIPVYSRKKDGSFNMAPV